MLDVLLKQRKIIPKDETANAPHVIVRSDKPVKSFLKSLSWRLVGSIDTIIISYFVTGRITMAVSIGSVEVITKTLLYYLHERAWIRIHKIRFKILSRNNGGQLEIEEPERSAFRAFRFGKS